MNIPIKPPGGPKGPSDAGPPSAGEAGRGFQEALERVQPSESGPSLPNELGALVEKLRSGELGVESFMERLVERVAASHGGALTPAAKAGLEGFLKRSLADDPTLQSLVEELNID